MYSQTAFLAVPSSSELDIVWTVSKISLSDDAAAGWACPSSVDSLWETCDWITVAKAANVTSCRVQNASSRLTSVIPPIVDRTHCEALFRDRDLSDGDVGSLQKGV